MGDVLGVEDVEGKLETRSFMRIQVRIGVVNALFKVCWMQGPKGS